MFIGTDVSKTEHLVNFFWIWWHLGSLCFSQAFDVECCTRFSQLDGRILQQSPFSVVQGCDLFHRSADFRVLYKNPLCTFEAFPLHILELAPFEFRISPELWHLESN